MPKECFNPVIREKRRRTPLICSQSPVPKGTPHFRVPQLPCRKPDASIFLLLVDRPDSPRHTKPSHMSPGCSDAQGRSRRYMGCCIVNVKNGLKEATLFSFHFSTYVGSVLQLRTSPHGISMAGVFQCSKQVSLKNATSNIANHVPDFTCL